ncbi:uncharacterized protein B0H18DRAFT_1118242 [Fomitopsis serialis]|uniref:uncharacterized protein n=1 Tax=Fomitopsis serialis TaxID=139415 RepID=UPI0020085888|nr:uncharacterized protein B0H18DRAFT_1118242 [Neoantrodia serialis]KAH9927715.1 hypothetical protein B0H18DRAFT_1118242 [Neoantrodia serialis]
MTSLQKRDLDVLNLRLEEWRKLPEDGEQRGEIVAEAVDKLGKIRGYPLDNVMREEVGQWFANHETDTEDKEPVRKDLIKLGKDLSWRTVCAQAHEQELEELIKKHGNGREKDTKLYPSIYQTALKELCDGIRPLDEAKYRKTAAEYNATVWPREYQYKHLARHGNGMVSEFVQLMWRKCGVRVFVLGAYLREDGQTGNMQWDYNNAYPRSGPGTEPPNFIQVFKDFRRGNTYEMWKKYAEDAFNANGFEGEESIVPSKLIDRIEWKFDDDGYPILPPADHECFKKTDHKRMFLSTFVRMTYAHYTRRENIRVPWQSLSEKSEEFFEDGYLPAGVVLSDPNKIRAGDLDAVLRHWRVRQDADDGEPVLRFKAWRNAAKQIVEVEDEEERVSSPSPAPKPKRKPQPKPRRRRASPAARRASRRAKSDTPVDSSDQEASSVDSDAVGHGSLFEPAKDLDGASSDEESHDEDSDHAPEEVVVARPSKGKGRAVIAASSDEDDEEAVPMQTKTKEGRGGGPSKGAPKKGGQSVGGKSAGGGAEKTSKGKDSARSTQSAGASRNQAAGDQPVVSTGSAEQSAKPKSGGRVSKKNRDTVAEGNDEDAGEEGDVPVQAPAPAKAPKPATAKKSTTARPKQSTKSDSDAEDNEEADSPAAGPPKKNTAGAEPSGSKPGPRIQKGSPAKVASDVDARRKFLQVLCGDDEIGKMVKAALKLPDTGTWHSTTKWEWASWSYRRATCPSSIHNDKKELTQFRRWLTTMESSLGENVMARDDGLLVTLAVGMLIHDIESKDVAPSLNHGVPQYVLDSHLDAAVATDLVKRCKKIRARWEAGSATGSKRPSAAVDDEELGTGKRTKKPRTEPGPPARSSKPSGSKARLSVALGGKVDSLYTHCIYHRRIHEITL